MKLLPRKVQMALAGVIATLIAGGGAGVLLVPSGGAAAVGTSAHTSSVKSAYIVSVCLTIREINFARHCVVI